MGGLVDLHTHVLPGVDDGADELDESVRMLEGLRELDFAHVFATPHHRLDSWKGISPLTVLSGVRVLEEAVLKNRLDVRLYPGIEYDLDETLAERAADRPCGGRYVLVDIGFWGVPHDLPGLLGQVKELGVEILLAHPERNGALCRQPELIKSLFLSNVLFTGNLGSLSGFYGEQIRKDCLELLRGGFYWAMASDLHSPEQLSWIRSGLAELRENVDPAGVQDLLYHHPILVAQAIVEETA